MAKEFDFNQGIPGKYSALKVLHHPEKMQALREGVISAPVYLRFNPTNRCDEECFYCVYISNFSGIHPTMNYRDELPREKVLETLDDFKDMGVKAVTWSGGGESLLPKYAPEMLKRTVENGIGLSAITNGLRLSGERAEILANAGDWVRISIDYCDENMFKKIRKRGKVAFDQTVQNMSYFAKIKNPKCDFEANCVIHEHNYDKLFDIAKFLKETGVENVRFSPVWFKGFEEYHAPFKQRAIEEIAKAKEKLEDGTFEVGSTYEKYFINNSSSSQRLPRCLWGEIVSVIGADGNVNICHNKSYDPSGVIGSINDQSFKQMWFSEQTRNFFRNFDPRKLCNHECSAHERNLLLEEFLASSDPKLNIYP
ncbi:MAG: radical SAM protein [Candidatus Pacearchaeota archaeon]